ncbi:MAG: hypothetical protein AB1744_07045 [Candidatus Zixiibacteriota bacterium]
MGSVSAKTGILITLSTAVLGLSAYYYLYRNFYFFMFALLPPVPDRFTVDQDWLFSAKHFVDMVNLLLVLVPGLAVLLVALLPSFRKRWYRWAEYRFLLLMLLGTGLAVFVLNPGIGMPRNWDLFSIVGVPLGVLLFYAILDRRLTVRTASLAIMLATVLGLLTLVPRVAAQHVPELALRHIQNYLVLDKKRNRATWSFLMDYHEQRGDTLLARELKARWYREFPELWCNDQTQALMNQGRHAEALAPARASIQMNPIYWSGYHNLGASYYQVRQFDSAQIYLEIANGLNPNNAETLALLGGVHFQKRNYRRAEKYFERSYQLDSTLENALLGQVWLHAVTGRCEASFGYLKQVYDRDMMTYDFFREAADTYLRQGDYRIAARTYTYAMNRGLDSAYVDSQLVRFPQLSRWLK